MDRIVHETDSDENHRLIVNDVPGFWTTHAGIACCGVYQATTEYFDGLLPRVFSVIEEEAINLGPTEVDEE